MFVYTHSYTTIVYAVTLDTYISLHVMRYMYFRVYHTYIIRFKNKYVYL